MALTDTAIRNTKSADKPLKLTDERGLYLLLKPNGSRWWRFDYRYGGKRKTLSMGVYPDVSLKDARNRRDEARKLLASDVDPGENRKAVKAAKLEKTTNSFEVITREWYAKFSPTWNESHGERIIRRFERDIFPWIGSKPISEIAAPELLATVRRIESRGAVETAHRALGNCGQVFRYAIATARATRDISADLRGALPPVKGEHFAAITEPKQVGALLRAIDGYTGSHVVRCALRLAPLVFVRPGELRKAEWKDIDLDGGEWRYTVTKTNTPHIVPLSTQAVEILKELQALTGRSRFVFPGARTNGRPMSDNAILAALRRMGIDKEEMSGHGFRAMARTILDEVLGVRPDFIEHQLAHSVRDPNGRAYNRTAHLPERRKMMQQWADYLDKLKAGAEIIPLHGVA
ncbi:Integrase [Nitrosospira multiformis ATCC 25196]|uniref:Integrase n=1 Tax=Nitrosospira multiformis (strain ATCC 25196 / NCIMB 11849 / C 71) TaxID=323848 RepID=Q2Y6Z5_NITMU|nr:integrase arm-type DNA-binding domain-containing protein [Nitrosospira multiformis]ABB75476.1 Phage integrase [Nitrosospira multiformis ATCC 25196]SEG02753.1 Integrase [Nitrosospira multiformis ATCC 25196]